MTLLAVMRIARRLQAGVLILWLACLGAATAAPCFAAPVPVAEVCGGHAGSAGNDGPAAPKGHGLQCPNCLPVGAPSPFHAAAVTAALPSHAPSVGPTATPFLHHRAARPPARAPPPRVLNPEVTS